MKLARSILKLFSAKVFTTFLQIVAIAYFARELGASSLGVFFLFQALIGMLSIPADAGISKATEKRISEGAYQGNFLASAAAVKTAPVLVIGILVIYFQDIVNNYLGEEVAVLLAVAIAIQQIYTLSISTLKGELRVGEIGTISSVHKVAWVVISFILVSIGLGVTGLIYGLIAGNILAGLISWYKISVVPKRPTLNHAQSLFEYGKFDLVSSIGGYFYNWMDVVLIGFFLTQSHVAAYEVAWRVTTAIILLSRSIATTIFPQISEWDSDDARSNIEELIPKVLTPSLLFVIPAFFGTVLLSEEILSLVFGEEYAIAALALVILMFDRVTEAFQLIIGRSLQAINRPDLAARATVFGVILNLTLNIILIPTLGIVGAAVGTMIASLIGGLILHSYYLSKFININVPYRELAGCVSASAGMSVIVFTLQTLADVDGILKLLLLIGMGASVYVLLLLLFPMFRSKAFTQTSTILVDKS